MDTQLPYPVLIEEEVPSLTATCYIMTSWYIWEACHFLESKEKEWVEEGGYVKGLGGEEEGRGKCDQAENN